MMDDTSVCTPLFAESDSQNNTPSTPNAASVAYTDKVINTKIDSTLVEGGKTEEELLKGLLADDYCHICEAVLLYESQRMSHYEGKKHAQKLKVFLQARRADTTNRESTGPQRIMTTDKDRFCELCNMVFSSHVVAKSHYEGKVHTKNLRKQGLQPPVAKRYTELRSLTPDPNNSDQNPALQDCMEHLVDPAASTATPSTEFDLKDSNKYCALCAASFNNPQMASQHYNGRKHQRNQARQELIHKLGDNVQQANSLMCQMCGVQFNSVEMYQAHMQGNKHHIREKKVTDLCNQQKVYSTFSDELADYIQVQKARGITPKMGQVLRQCDTLQEDEKEGQEILNIGEVGELNIPMPNIPPSCKPHHQSHPGCYYPAGGWHSLYHSQHGPPHGWDSNCPPPVLSGSGSVKFPSQSIKRKRNRRQSSSSSYTTSSSYSSSYSSCTSDSDDNEYSRREGRKIRRSRKERGRKGRDEGGRRRKQHRADRDKDSEERGRGESGESEHESRKKRKNRGKRSRTEKKSQEEDFKKEGRERLTDTSKPENSMDTNKQADVHIQAEMNVDEGGGGQDEQAKLRYRKEKKKVKEKRDTRTEEEKLWDDSILGC